MEFRAKQSDSSLFLYMYIIQYNRYGNEDVAQQNGKQNVQFFEHLDSGVSQLTFKPFTSLCGVTSAMNGCSW